MYSIIGIQGLIRLAIRRPRGRVYDVDIEVDEVDERDGEAQLDAIGHGAGENGCWGWEGREWWVLWDRIQGGMEEMGEGACERLKEEGPATGDMSRV